MLIPDKLSNFNITNLTLTEFFVVILVNLFNSEMKLTLDFVSF